MPVHATCKIIGTIQQELEFWKAQDLKVTQCVGDLKSTKEALFKKQKV